MVLLPAGKIDYKPVNREDTVPEGDRHEMVRRAVRPLEPLLRYTDVACGTAEPGDAAFHRLRKLNPDRPMEFVLVWGVESSQRVRRIVEQAAKSLRNQHDLGRAGDQTVSFAFLKRDGCPAEDLLTESLLSEICVTTGLSVPCRLKTIELQILSRMDSTRYRTNLDPAMVPACVHDYVIKRGFYPRER